MKPVTLNDFRASVNTKQNVQTEQRTFVGLFLEPNLFATGHHTLGVQLWHYPSLRRIRVIKHYNGYVTRIQKFTGTKIIAVSDDTDEEVFLKFYNYETGETVGEEFTTSKMWACVSPKTIFFFEK